MPSMSKSGMLRSALLAVSVLATGCMTSRAPQNLPQATSPFGQSATVRVDDGHEVTGELLAVTDSAWYLMVDGRVSSVRTGAIIMVRVTNVGNVWLKANPGGYGVTVDVARQGARFPHGISPAVLTTLLANASQAAPDDLSRRPP